MTIGAFDAAADALQLVVPSYGLRLVRRFGTHRVGWFIVTAFISLAALHLLAPPTGASLRPEVSLNIAYAIGSVLLLVGMGHIETFFRQHDRSHSAQEMLNSDWEAQLRKETNDLARANESLRLELAHREKTDAELRESEAQFRFLFTENPQPMWVFGLRDRHFLAVNNAALRQYGFSRQEFMQLTPRDLLPPEQVEAFDADIAQACAKSEVRSRWQHFRKDQTVIDVELTARDFDFAGARARLVVVHDITEQQEREQADYRVRKMELVGRLTGGVAHRFNDVLSVIENHTAILRQTARDAATMDQLQEISIAATRGSNLGYQMLAASGRQVMQPRPLDLNRLIGNLNLILRRIGGEQVILQNLCGRNPLPVMADPKVIENIIITLVKNSRDAIAGKGMVTIATGVVRVDNPPIVQEGAEATNEFVRLCVRDTGCGMAPEVQEHLFEPFFTTKTLDKGQGLGLAGVFGAVRQHWGWIECTSAVDAGTEFRIFFPCVSESLLPSATEIQAATMPDRGTVLLVDSDDRARGVARYVLNRNGYRVIEADSSSIALVLWEGQARSIDLLLTDLSLPGSSGFDLANQLCQRRPDLKVIYACANETELKGPNGTLPEGVQFVTKPYLSDKLVETIEAALPQNGPK
jgi:two-component system cell cycle sensor histidine kinase/response regulator CckA